MDNYVHDNNNPNVPAAGEAAAGPVGTGMSISGGRNDTIMDNRFVNNGAWGTIFVPYPDTETPPSDVTDPCNGGVGGAGNVCNYDDWGNSLLDNTYTNNGFFGNQTNGDFAESTTTPDHPINCFSGNTDTSGTLTSSPSTLEQTTAPAGRPRSRPTRTPRSSPRSTATRSSSAPGSPCPPGASYPRATGVVMHPLPSLQTMPDPCSGVPANPWCNGQVLPTTRCVAQFVTVNLKVAKRERLTSVSVKIARQRGTGTRPEDAGPGSG